MARNKDAFNTRAGALWVQPGGPNTEVHYLGCHDLADIVEKAGSLELVRCFDKRGGWKTVGATQSPPDAITTSIENLTFKARDWLESLQCDFNLYAMQRVGGSPDNFYNFVRVLALTHSRIVTTTDKGLVNSDEEISSTQSRDVEAWPPVIRTGELTARRQVTSETLALNDVFSYSALNCPDGILPGDQVVAGADSSSYSGNVLQTLNKGSDWAALAADPFAAGKDILAIVAFPISATVNRILAAKEAEPGGQGQVAYSDDNGATWTVVSIGGAAAGHGASSGSSLFALDQGHIWLASPGGYIYFSSDGGATWTAQTTGDLTTAVLRAITFYDENYGMAGGAGDVFLFTSNGGETWEEASGNTGSGGDIYTLSATGNFWWCGTDDGKIFYSRDDGVTWSERSFSGKGTGVVTDIAFANELVGYMTHNTTAPVGRIFVTVNGGFTWNILTVPTNVGLNALSVVDSSTVYAVGEPVDGTAMIIKLEWN